MSSEILLDDGLEGLQDILESLTFEGHAIGKVFIDFPDMTDEAKYNGVVVNGNYNQTVWIATEGNTAVAWRDARRYSYQANYDFVLQGFRPFEYGRTKHQDWRRLYQYVLRQLNGRIYAQLGLDAPGAMMEAWSVTSSDIHPVGAEQFTVDCFFVTMGGMLNNSIVSTR